MYTITSYQLSEETYMRVLTPCGHAPFIEELARSPKTRRRAALIARTADRLQRFGRAWGFESGTLKWIAPEVSLCELRVGGKVIRVMAYLPPEPAPPIYLFDFDGHQGKDVSIPAHVKSRAKELAVEAKRCIEREASHD